MADNPATGKEEAEEEEEQEGKATVSATGSPSQNASKAGSDSATRNGTPALSQHPSANATQTASPVPTENVSEHESGTGFSQSSSEASKNASARTVSLGDEKRSLSPSLKTVPKSASQNTGWSGERNQARNISERRGSSTAAQFPRTPSKSGTTTASATPSSPPGELDLTDLSRSNTAHQSLPQTPSIQTASEAPPKNEPRTEDDSNESARGTTSHRSSANLSKRFITSKSPLKDSLKQTGHSDSAPQAPGFGSSRLFERRSPFVHNPPLPEERRSRISHPQCPRDYIINLREDLADFQESHGLPRTRDYSFMSLGLSLAQETGRAIYAVFLMITELFPVIAIVSLILRFSLDKLIEILETDGVAARVKKSAIFAFQILIIMIPLWILVGTIIIPLFYLMLSIFRRLFRLSGRKKAKAKIGTRPGPHHHHHHHHPPVKVKK